MRRILSLLLLTLWLLMNGSSSYAFSKVNESLGTSKATLANGVTNLKASFFEQRVPDEEDHAVYYEEEEDEDDEELFHQAARLHAVILYQLLFLFDGYAFRTATLLTQEEDFPLVTPVYLAFQNFRI